MKQQNSSFELQTLNKSCNNIKQLLIQTASLSCYLLNKM
ncbi:hypothetical protein X975_13361, partial [Stegodyphus mimosarum]